MDALDGEFVGFWALVSGSRWEGGHWWPPLELGAIGAHLWRWAIIGFGCQHVLLELHLDLLMELLLDLPMELMMELFFGTTDGATVGVIIVDSVGCCCKADVVVGVAVRFTDGADVGSSD